MIDQRINKLFSDPTYPLDFLSPSCIIDSRNSIGKWILIIPIQCLEYLFIKPNKMTTLFLLTIWFSHNVWLKVSTIKRFQMSTISFFYNFITNKWYLYWVYNNYNFISAAIKRESHILYQYTNYILSYWSNK